MSTDPRLFPNLTDPMRTDYEGPPVRDIREAMHPASAPPSGEAPWTPGTPAKEITVRNVRLPVTIPLAEVPPGVLADIDRQHDAEKSPPRLRLGGGPIAIAPATVATLPDGARINLPAGTVLREGEGPPPPVRFFDLANSLRAAFARVEEAVPEPAAPMDLAEVEQLIRAWDALKAEMVAQEKINAPVRVVAPPSTIEHARDLLRRAQAWIAPGVPDIARPGTEAQPAATIGQLRAEIAAFLAGAAQPEHPVIALVRSFVGKPGEGPEVNIEPLPPHLAALLAEHPRWSIADAERSIVDTTEGRDPPK